MRIAKREREAIGFDFLRAITKERKRQKLLFFSFWVLFILETAIKTGPNKQNKIKSN